MWSGTGLIPLMCNSLVIGTGSLLHCARVGLALRPIIIRLRLHCPRAEFAQQPFIKTSLLYCLQPKRAGGLRLWIKIDNQNAPAELRQRSAEVYGRGRFADATFLICDRDDFHSLLRIFRVCGTCMMMLPVAGNEN